ncbi:MAG: hypothetical protein LUF78_09985 [Clostridiales bacterium]|nr:hypothetical protein [Clostridiales bacterium]
MNGPFRRIRQYYMDLKLQSKFTLVMLLLVLLPAILIAYLLLGNIYNMVVSYTIQQEQDSSAQTAPLIEERIQDVMDTASEISSSSFYAALFHQPVNKPLSVYASSGKAAEFRQTVDALLDSGRATGIRIYVEWANENSELFSHENTEGIFFREAPQAEPTGMEFLTETAHSPNCSALPFTWGPQNGRNAET